MTRSVPILSFPVVTLPLQDESRNTKRNRRSDPAKPESTGNNGLRADERSSLVEVRMSFVDVKLSFELSQGQVTAFLQCENEALNLIGIIVIVFGFDILNSLCYNNTSASDACKRR